jgi:hypothetical protein
VFRKLIRISTALPSRPVRAALPIRRAAVAAAVPGREIRAKVAPGGFANPQGGCGGCGGCRGGLVCWKEKHKGKLVTVCMED